METKQNNEQRCRYEYVVHSYEQPARTRYQSTFSSDWHGIIDVFESRVEAFEEAFKLIRGGAFDVSIQLDKVNLDTEDTIHNVEALPCPYQEIGINQELQELHDHKKEAEDALLWSVIDAPNKVDRYAETLEKINCEIEQITGISTNEK